MIAVRAGKKRCERSGRRVEAESEPGDWPLLAARRENWQSEFLPKLVEAEVRED